MQHSYGALLMTSLVIDNHLWAADQSHGIGERLEFFVIDFLWIKQLKAVRAELLVLIRVEFLASLMASRRSGTFYGHFIAIDKWS